MEPRDAKTGLGHDDTTPRGRVSLVDAAYGALKAAIRDNRLAPGEQGSEQEIATRLGMSRTPVHEAVIRLQEEGLVRVLPRRGVQVCPLSPDDMREIYDVLIALEGASAELIAAMPPGRRGAVVEELAAVTATMATALERDALPDWAAADGRFHQLLAERCGNRRLARMVHAVTDQSHRARMLTLRLRPKPAASAREHGGILQAIRRGDAATARDRARSHRIRARDRLLPLLAQLGMRQL